MRRFDTREWIEDGEARVEFEAVPGGTWVTFLDAEAAIDAANQRATDAESRLALAVAEVKAWRDGRLRRNRLPGPTGGGNVYYEIVGDTAISEATNADPVLKAMIEAKMIGGGE